MATRCALSSVEERGRSGRWLVARGFRRTIARLRGRHRSTILRELRRDSFVDHSMAKMVGYVAMAAQTPMVDRHARPRKLLGYHGLRGTVERRPNAGWTPEYIAGRMRLESLRPRMCQETI